MDRPVSIGEHSFVFDIYKYFASSLRIGFNFDGSGSHYYKSSANRTLACLLLLMGAGDSELRSGSLGKQFLKDSEGRELLE